MLEEQLLRDLIDKGAQVSICQVTFKESFNFKGSIGPLKADFSANTGAHDLAVINAAVCHGEGIQVGKDALKLLKKIHQAKIDGTLSSYRLQFTAPQGCDAAHLFLDREGFSEWFRVPYTESQWEETYKQKCAAQCKYQDICPSYLAKKAGKALYFFERPKKD